MTDYLFVALKGAAMGAANVIPGVSGGTIAFITGIYERLIDAIKSCNPKAVKLLIDRKFHEFAEHTDLAFLAAVASGAVLSILSLAKALEHAFKFHPVPTWAFFFGLILASIWGVGKMVERWGIGTLLASLLGMGAAIGLLFLPQGSGNDSFVFLVICGAVAISSMIIPGVSGSFVLLIMGNYALVLGAISNRDLGILFPFAIGCGVGLISLSHLLSWIFKHHHDIAVALITGFIAGSLVLIWPWKDTVYKTDAGGALLVKTAERELVARSGSLEEVSRALTAQEELVTVGYRNWHAPAFSEASTLPAVGIAVFGAALVILIEWLGVRFGRNRATS